MRDNGAIVGAADGFKEDDEVIVMQHKNGSPIKVLGHVDGVVPCKSPYLAIYIYNHYSGQYARTYVIVWDVKKGKLADDVLISDNPPVYASFPCLHSSAISSFLSGLGGTVEGALYNTPYNYPSEISSSSYGGMPPVTSYSYLFGTGFQKDPLYSVLFWKIKTPPGGHPQNGEQQVDWNLIGQPVAEPFITGVNTYVYTYTEETVGGVLVRTTETTEVVPISAEGTAVYFPIFVYELSVGRHFVLQVCYTVSEGYSSHYKAERRGNYGGWVTLDNTASYSSIKKTRSNFYYNKDGFVDGQSFDLLATPQVPTALESAITEAFELQFQVWLETTPVGGRTQAGTPRYVVASVQATLFGI